jgi:hypothetical protein
MAASEIKAKFSASAKGTINVSALATNTVRQSTMIDNTTDKYQLIHVYCKVTTGTSPTAGRNVFLYAITGDKHATPFRTDGAGASDAAWTTTNGPPIIASKGTSSSSNQVVYLYGKIFNPGPEWGIGIEHTTAVNLKTESGSAAPDGTDHWFHWVGENPENQ